MKKSLFILIFILSVNINAQQTFNWLNTKQIYMNGVVDDIESTIAKNGNQIYDNTVHPSNVGLRVEIWRDFSIAISLIDEDRIEFDIRDDTLENFSIMHKVNGKNVNTKYKGVVAGNVIFFIRGEDDTYNLLKLLKNQKQELLTISLSLLNKKKNSRAAYAFYISTQNSEFEPKLLD
jgi:hypothetical protein